MEQGVNDSTPRELRDYLSKTPSIGQSVLNE